MVGMLIKNAKELVNSAVKQLKEYQDGKSKPIKTRYKHFNENCIGGIHRGMVILLAGISGCVDEKTEYFDGKQWKAIKDYEHGDFVLQYDPIKGASLVLPTEFHKYKADRLWHIQGEGIDQVLCESHNFFYRDSNGNLLKEPFSKVLEKYQKTGRVDGRILTTFKLNDSSISTSVTEDEIAFRVLLQAEGLLLSTNFYYLQDNNRKSYKILCQAQKLGYITDLKKFNNAFIFYLTPKMEYDIPNSWYFLDQKSRRTFLKYVELLNWEKNVYSEDADFIQFLYACESKRATIDRYVNYSVEIDNEIHLSDKYTITPYKGKSEYKYCFSVPTGLLVFRRSKNIFVTGNSGKTYTLQQIEEDIFNKKLNPNCKDYVLLRCNWEMSVFKLLVRKLKRSLNRHIKDILFEKPKEDELVKYKEVCDSERSDNIFYLEEPTDPDTWFKAVDAFLSDMKKKKHVVVTIDHIALVRDLLGSKKKSMDELIEHINTLKKKYTNVSFIVLSQLNRDIESRTDIKTLNPKRSDIYNSDTMYHIADIVLVTHNPYKLGHDKYMIIPGLAQDEHGDFINGKYAYLAEFMDKPNNKMTNFKTKGVIFWHYLKLREIEDDSKDIAIEKLDFGAFEKLNKHKGLVKIREDMDNPFGNEEDDGVPF